MTFASSFHKAVGRVKGLKSQKIEAAGAGPLRKQRTSIKGKKLKKEEFQTSFSSIEEIQGTGKTAEETKFLEETLKENFLFTDLAVDEFDLLLRAMQKEVVTEGGTIIKQGDVGDFFYIVQSGTVNFIIGEGQNAGNCRKGGSFGELALLYDTPRAATCIAGTDAVLWKVGQTTFRSVQAGYSAKGADNDAELFKTIPLFASLDEAQMSKFSDALTTVHFKKGERIVTKGEQGDTFYIVSNGNIKVHDIGMGDSQVVDQILGPGGVFGERALLTGEPRAANVTALTDNVALQSIGRETFESVLGNLQHIIDHEMKKTFLKGCPIFARSNLLPKEVDDLVKNMKEEEFPKGTKIVELGKTEEPKLCIIQKGKVNVFEGNGKIHNLESGDYFGARRIKDNVKDKETIMSEETTTCWVLTKSDIKKILGDVNRLGSNIPFISSKRNQSIRQADLEKYVVLGQGAYGLVWLVAEKKPKEKKIPYALKIVNKQVLVETKQTGYIQGERDLLSILDHPFLLGLVSSFQDPGDLYLLMELIQGGELFDHVHQPAHKGNGVSNADAKFFAACVVDGLGHLHDRYICYRDLKPENVMIDHKGYCMIVDMGFAKIVPNKTYSMVGTPEYLAPEIITGKGHNKAVDHWATGVLIYEMLVGESPFIANTGGDQMNLFRNIVRGRYSHPDTPGKVCNNEAKDIIKKLLTKKQAGRLGNLLGGVSEIESHPWFSDMDFEKLLKREISAPWIPKLDDPFSSKPSNVDVSKNPGLTSEEQALFSTF